MAKRQLGLAIQRGLKCASDVLIFVGAVLRSNSRFNYAAGAVSDCWAAIASNTARGLRCITDSNTRADPVGLRRLCSQLQMVAGLTPRAFAKAFCVMLPGACSLIALTSIFRPRFVLIS